MAEYLLSYDLSATSPRRAFDDSLEKAGWKDSIAVPSSTQPHRLPETTLVGTFSSGVNAVQSLQAAEAAGKAEGADFSLTSYVVAPFRRVDSRSRRTIAAGLLDALGVRDKS